MTVAQAKTSGDSINNATDLAIGVNCSKQRQ